ncbi:MAG: hypothetical protein P8189_18785 [Anaerolineae bacterium]|jgi:hypothetical protein
MNDWPEPRESETYRYHWVFYWKALSIVCLLIVLGTVAIFARPGTGLVLWGLALAVFVGIWLHRSWHSITLTDDGRMVRRGGVLGCTRDIINLWGVITPYEIPILGRWLDVGSVHLGIPGPDLHIRHITPFSVFYRRLVYGAQRREEHRHGAPIQVFVQYPGVPNPWVDPVDLLHPDGPADQLGMGGTEGEGPS